jgi:uncharacterized protein YbaP (TraB family)
MKISFLYLLVSLSIACFAQTGNNSVLWKISGNGLQEPSYLFGTIHAVPEKQFIISDTILKYLEISKTLVLEINPEIPLGAQLKLAQRMFLPKGKTIKDYIDSIHYAQLYTYLKDSINIKEEKINKYFALKPVFMQSMILMEFIEKPKTYEKELKNLVGKKKHFVPLETIDEQMNMLDSIPLELQLSFNSDNYKLDKEYFSLLNLYLKQDIKAIDSLMFSDPDFQKIEYNLLTERNLNWVPKIKESISKESSFVAVGCAHLIGENGLIKLLEKEGYTINPVRYNNQ